MPEDKQRHSAGPAHGRRRRPAESAGGRPPCGQGAPPEQQQSLQDLEALLDGRPARPTQPAPQAQQPARPAPQKPQALQQTDPARRPQVFDQLADDGVPPTPAGNGRFRLFDQLDGGEGRPIPTRSAGGQPELFDLLDEDDGQPSPARAGGGHPELFDLLNDDCGEDYGPSFDAPPPDRPNLGQGRRPRAGGGLTQGELKPKKERPYKQRRPEEARPKMRLWKKLVLAAASLLAVGAVSFGFFFVYTTRNDDLWLDLSTLPYRGETILYYTDRASGDTGVFARIPCTQNKEYVSGEALPQALKDAFVAIEDKNFYQHSGVSLTRTAYAVLNEGVHALTGSYIGGDGGRRQGASTIDQQLIKNLTRDDSDSAMAGYARKLREFCRALRLDALYEKDEILVAYLNAISFTGNTAGVQAEAKKLYGKTVDQLTLAECAGLAAITRNPARYNPVTHPEEHLERRTYVLSEMRDQGYITAEQAAQAAAEPLNLAYTGEPKLPEYVTSWFTDTVIDAVITELAGQRGITRKEASNLLYNGGLRIYTTVDPALQRAMEGVMESSRYHPLTRATATKQLADDEGNPLVDENGKAVLGQVSVTPQAAMVSLDYEGGICAIVGSLGEKTISRGFNRATSAVRQVGSTMKPIGPYVTALEEGWITWSSAFNDSPVMQMEDEASGEKTDWPANVTRVYTEKDILVREALAKSVNTVAVRVGREVGNRSMYEFVRGQLGIESLTRQDTAPGPLVLGSSTYGITPLDMAKAYAMFGNGGKVVTPHCFTRITGGTGTQMLKVDTGTRQVIGEDTAFIMNRLLGQVLESGGTAAGLGVPGAMDSVGKTGTTSDNRDHWFVGLTPYYVTASWYGYDENMSLAVDVRNHPPTLAWRAVMSEGQAGLPAIGFPQQPAGVVEREYCTVSGHAAGANCPKDSGYYKWWQLPAGGCPVHDG